MPDDVQPDTGRGDTATGGPIDAYLQTVPEEYRPHVRPFVEGAQKGLSSQLEELTTLRNTLGPYQAVEHLTQYDPESLGQLLQWHQQVTSSDEAFKTWLASVSTDAGLSPAETQELEDSDLSRDQIAKMVSDLADQRLGPVQARVDQWENDQMIATERQLIQESFQKIEAEHKITLDEEQRSMIVDLGIAATKDNETLANGTDWIAAGYARLEKMVAQGQKTFVDQKLNQPKMPLTSGGTASTERPKTWAEAEDSARERLRISRST